MKMRRHQTKAKDTNLLSSRFLRNQGKEVPHVFASLEQRAASNATVHDVMPGIPTIGATNSYHCALLQALCRASGEKWTDLFDDLFDIRASRGGSSPEILTWFGTPVLFLRLNSPNLNLRFVLSVAILPNEKVNHGTEKLRLNA